MIDLTSPDELKTLLNRHGIRLNTDRGQHFLICKKPIEDMLAAAEISEQDTILEIGPGIGTLTFALARRAGSVISIEVDSRLLEVARSLLRSQSMRNVTLIEGDFRKVHLGALPLVGGSYMVVANVPYQITSLLLRRLTEEEPRPKKIVVMVQREVARRVAAQPGEMSMLSVAVQYFGMPHLVAEVPKTCFSPVPDVDSAILSIDMYQEQRLPGELEQLFFRLVRIGFSARRKMLKNNLAAGLHQNIDEIREMLEMAGLDGRVRAQEVSIDKWIEILHDVISLGMFDGKRKI